jgi:hypothetical protein
VAKIFEPVMVEIESLVEFQVLEATNKRNADKHPKADEIKVSEPKRIKISEH